MTDEMTYEPPAMSLAGDFAAVTLGGGGWGFDGDGECWAFC